MTRSTLHCALPVIELLQTKWENLAKNKKYAPVKAGLEKGLDTFKKYYRKMDDTDLYTIIHILNPGLKMKYMENKWDKEYVDKALEMLKAMVCTLTSLLVGGAVLTSCPLISSPSTARGIMKQCQLVRQSLRTPHV